MDSSILPVVPNFKKGHHRKVYLNITDVLLLLPLRSSTTNIHTLSRSIHNIFLFQIMMTKNGTGTGVDTTVAPMGLFK